jgi:hypothetical protein
VFEHEKAKLTIGSSRTGQILSRLTNATVIPVILRSDVATESLPQRGYILQPRVGRAASYPG